MKRIAVVGASLAGLRAAESLRRLGFSGQLSLVGSEKFFPPYDRPPLSKEILRGEWGVTRGRLRVAEGLELDLRLGLTAVDLDLKEHEVRLSDESRLGFDGIVIATGANPRHLGIASRFDEGVYELRTYDDCAALRAALERRPRVVIIGAGFIGCEVAAACRAFGIEVVMVDPLVCPMHRVLGSEVGAWAAGVHRMHGVDLRLGTGVTDIEGDTAPRAVLLDDGSEIPADIVVSAVGVDPATGWLEDSGLILRDGVVLDEFCRAPGFHHVTGAGDVARWYNKLFDRELRVEHWTNAVEQATAAAASLLLPEEELKPLETVPYVWSDQYDLKLQYVGIAGRFAGVVAGSLETGKFVAAYQEETRLVGALCVNMPGKMSRCKKAITGCAPFDEFVAVLA